MRKGLRDSIFLVTVCSLCYFFQLGATHLWDEDEAYFGRTAREMDVAGDYIVPRFNDDISLHKPALMYWVMIVGTRLFGANEFALRAGSALFAIANVLLTYHLASSLFSRRVGFWSAVVLATSLEFVVISRAAVADQELLFFCTLPLACLLAGTKRLADFSTEPSSVTATSIVVSHVRWAAAYASMGMAALTKGPVGVVLPSAVIGLFLLLKRTNLRNEMTTVKSRMWPRRLASMLLHAFQPRAIIQTAIQMRPATAIVTLAVVALPWYLAVGWMTDGAWPRGFLLVHNVGRVITSFESHGGGFLYYPVVICIGTFPWSIFAAQAIRVMWLGLFRNRPQQSVFVLLGVWIAVWVGAFTIAGTKLPHYVLPAYPAISMVLGYSVTLWLSGRDIVTATWQRYSWLTLIVAGLGLLIAGPLLASYFMPGENFIGIIGLVPLISGFLGVWLNEIEKRKVAMQIHVVAAVGFMLSLLGWAAVRVDRHQSSPVVAQWMRELAPTKPRALCTHGCFEASLLYYCDQPVQKLGKQTSIENFFANASEPAFLLITDGKLAKMNEALPIDIEILRKTPRFLKRDQLLLLGRKRNTAPSLSQNMTVHPR